MTLAWWFRGASDRRRAPAPSGQRLTRRTALRSGSCRPTAGVLLVADVLAPGHRTARLVVLLHGDVHHEAVGRRAVPVVLAGLEEHAVAGADLLDRAAFALAEPDAFGDEDRLSVRVGVPGGARAGREVHECCGEGRAAGGCGDGVDVDIAGEPVGRALHGVDGAAGDLHGLHPLLAAGGWCWFGWPGSPQAVWPPSTTMACPTVNAASCEHIHNTAAAISSGRPMRPIGSWPMTAARPSSVSPVKRRIISVSMMPGQTALMRMPCAA